MTLDELEQDNAQLRMEIEELRRENAALREQLHKVLREVEEWKRGHRDEGVCTARQRPCQPPLNTYPKSMSDTSESPNSSLVTKKTPCFEPPVLRRSGIPGLAPVRSSPLGRLSWCQPNRRSP
jgi:hypothetical protein